MTILKATMEHLDSIARLFDEYRVFYGENSDRLGARHFIRQRLEASDSVIFIAINEEGDVLGFTQLYPSLSSILMQPIWILNDIFVGKDARRRHVGKALLSRVRDYGRQTGRVRIELSTQRTNEAAQRLYESVGFERDRENYYYLLNV